MNPYAYSVLAFGFCSFLIGLFVWFRLASDIGFKYFVFSAIAGVWGMLLGIYLIDSTTYETALTTARLSNAAAALLSPTWYHFTMVFTNQRRQMEKVVLVLLYLSGFFVLANSFSPSFIPEVREIMSFKHYAKPGWIFNVETVTFFIGVCLGFKNLFKYIAISIGEERKSCLGLCISTLAGYIGGSFTFLPVYGIEFPQYLMFITPLYPVLMALSMMRFDLFNVANFAQAAHKDKLAALGMVTASMNHEIRSPLFLMRGMIETEGKDSPLANKLLSQINRVTEIVSRLTHFAKKGVDEEAKIEALDLKEVLTDIRPLFQHQLNYQNIEYTQDIPTDLPKVMADRRYLEEILFNLILNACQALKNTPNPKITLTGAVLGTQSRGLPPMISSDSRFTNYAVRSTSSIAIAIEDNGPGIAPDQQKNIFKPFHTTKSEGTGLGLYITKQLVEKCGGKIEVQSESNKGAKFSVRLNLK